MSTFKERLAAIEERIDAACVRSGRKRKEVRLMAVSKVHPASAMLEAVDAGVTLFGENRVQEFERKHAELAAAGVGVAIGEAKPGIEVHLIGHLQSNKTAKAAEFFSGVDTIDSLRVAERLNDSAKKMGHKLPVLVEIKLSEEEAKSGFQPGSRELDEFFEKAPHLYSLHVRGLMTVPPLDDDLEAARQCFRQLRQLRESYAARYSAIAFDELSMGMSGDFEIAIEEGSTLVRIGTALFGQRVKQA